MSISGGMKGRVIGGAVKDNSKYIHGTWVLIACRGYTGIERR